MRRLPSFGIHHVAFFYHCILALPHLVGSQLNPNAWQSIHMIIFIATAESFFPWFHSTTATKQLHVIHINFSCFAMMAIISWICTHCILDCTLLFVKLFTLIGTGVRMGELCGKGSCIKLHLYCLSLCHQTYWPCLTHWGIMSSMSTSRLLAILSSVLEWLLWCLDISA